jgi:hypothetical protein
MKARRAFFCNKHNKSLFFRFYSSQREIYHFFEVCYMYCREVPLSSPVVMRFNVLGRFDCQFQKHPHHLRLVRFDLYSLIRSVQLVISLKSIGSCGPSYSLPRVASVFPRICASCLHGS